MRRWAPQAAHKPLAPLKGELAARNALTEGFLPPKKNALYLVQCAYSTSPPPIKKHAPAPAGACDPVKLH